jgi:hypothetical protein
MPTADPSSDLVNTLTSAFFNFGPFFLAIFVQFFVIAKARAWYQEACVRQEPKASHEEQETYRYYFLGSIAASLAIFCIAVWAWWALNISSSHQYRFEIDGLAEAQQVSAVDKTAYSQDAWFYLKGSPSFHNVSFVIVSDRPIRKGDSFDIRYNVVPPITVPSTEQPLSAGSVTADLQVKYSGHPSDKFRIDVKDGHPIILSANPTGSASVALRHLASLAPQSPNAAGKDSQR